MLVYVRLVRLIPPSLFYKVPTLGMVSGDGETGKRGQEYGAMFMAIPTRCSVTIGKFTGQTKTINCVEFLFFGVL